MKNQSKLVENVHSVLKGVGGVEGGGGGEVWDGESLGRWR